MPTANNIQKNIEGGKKTRKVVPSKNKLPKILEENVRNIHMHAEFNLKYLRSLSKMALDNLVQAEQMELKQNVTRYFKEARDEINNGIRQIEDGVKIYERILNLNFNQK